MKKKELIAPIRTRGSILSRGGDVVDKTMSTPVRTRGTVTAPRPVLEQEHPLTLEGLMQSVREQVGGWPLTILVHGWGSPRADTFVTQLSLFSHKDDAMWLIPAEDRESLQPLLEEAVLLDMDQDKDQRIYRNLVGDVVFFPASKEDEVKQIEEWQQRARTIVIDGQGTHADMVLRASCDAKLATYRWAGEMTFEKYS
jgi:hypothetical protein